MAEYMVAGSEPMATETSMRGLTVGRAAAVVFGALFVGLPVHAGGAFVEDLHAVHAAVALAGFGVAGEDHGQGDEGAAVIGPAGEHGVIVQGEVVVFDDFLAGAAGDDFREEGTHFGELGEHFELAEEAFGHAHFEVFGDAFGDVIDGIDLERDFHAAHAGEGVDEDGDAGAAGFFEKQGGAAVFDGAVSEFGDLEFRIDLEGDALELLVLFECVDEVAEVLICHFSMPIYYDCKFI